MVVLHRSLGMIACLQLLIASSPYLNVEGKVGFGGTEQEWGYVTVRPSAHMFWWLYYTTSKEVTNAYEKPLLIWLTGGPGGSSSSGYGNFEEVGLLDLDLQPRNFSSVNNYNVLFIDAPVGTGFSYVSADFAFAETNAQIGADLLECIRGFLNENQEFETVPTYIIAESYGGKMAAELALVWIKAQETRNIKSNLKGVAFGNSWISPINSVLSWGTFLLNTGMVDTDGFNRIEEAAAMTKQAVENEDWPKAMELAGKTTNIIFRETDIINFFNIVHKTRSWQTLLHIYPHGSMSTENFPLGPKPIIKLMDSKVKTTLGLNVSWEDQNSKTYCILSGDLMKPVTHAVERLLNETDMKVFVYTGQYDLLAATPGTVAWVENLKWTNSTEWRVAPREPLVVDLIEGYVKQYGNFKMFWIRNAGHMVAKDNPVAMEAILKRLTQRAHCPRGSRRFQIWPNPRISPNS